MISPLAHSDPGCTNGNSDRTVRVVVTKSNPSRGSGYEVAHFIVEDRVLKSISDRDVFLPSLAEAAEWVADRYPTARLEREGNDHDGHLAALCFRCDLADVVPCEDKPVRL